MTYTIATPEMGTANVSGDALNNLLSASTEASFRYSGLGSFLSTWQTVLAGVDRFGTNPLPPNHEVTGLIFITRPKLNLSSMSLKQDRVLSTLNTREPYSFPFSIRSYLDSRFARDPLNAGDMMVTPFVNTDLPFIIPLTNCHMSSGGWPDFFIDTETSQGDSLVKIRRLRADQILMPGRMISRSPLEMSKVDTSWPSSTIGSTT